MLDAISPDDGQLGAGRLRTGLLSLAVALFVLLAGCTSAGTPGAAAASASTAPCTVTSPVPSSAAPQFPPFLPADDTTVTGTAGFGVVPILDQPDQRHIEHYQLTAKAALPKTAPVFRLSVAGMPPADQLGPMFGLSDSPLPPTSDPAPMYAWASNPGLQYEPTLGRYYWAAQPDVLRVDLPSDRESARAIARNFLTVRGLLPPDSSSVVDVEAPSAGAPTVWTVYFKRNICSVPVYNGGVVVQIDNAGGIGVNVLHRPIVGGSSYPLRSAASAWEQVKAGHWYASDGTFDEDHPTLASFRADQVEICYRETWLYPLGEDYLVPMYCFYDSHQHVRLYFPSIGDALLNWSRPTR